MNDPANSLSEVVPTLELLRKLPPAQKDRLLLARLEKMGRTDSNVLNKANLMLPKDPSGLARGYSDFENHAVREHLLGAPWTRLVTAGYLVDLNGQGFHKVSSEGHEFLEQEESDGRSYGLRAANLSNSTAASHVALRREKPATGESAQLSSFGEVV